MRTSEIAFVKRRVGRNVVRILQQCWMDLEGNVEWRDVPMRLEVEATKPEFPPAPD